MRTGTGYLECTFDGLLSFDVGKVDGEGGFAVFVEAQAGNIAGEWLGTGDVLNQSCQIFAAMNEAVLAEREACAALCEKMKSDAWRDAIVTRAHNTAASNCAAAIRARSNAGGNAT